MMEGLHWKLREKKNGDAVLFGEMMGKTPINITTGDKNEWSKLHIKSTFF